MGFLHHTPVKMDIPLRSWGDSKSWGGCDFNYVCWVTLYQGIFGKTKQEGSDYFLRPHLRLKLNSFFSLQLLKAQTLGLYDFFGPSNIFVEKSGKTVVEFKAQVTTKSGNHRIN